MGQRTDTIALAASATLTRAQANGDNLVVCDTSGGVVVPTLPADAEDGARVTIKRDGGAAVTITAGAGQTVEGAGTKSIATTLFSYTLQYDAANTDWRIISAYEPVG